MEDTNISYISDEVLSQGKTLREAGENIAGHSTILCIFFVIGVILPFVIPKAKKLEEFLRDKRHSLLLTWYVLYAIGLFMLAYSASAYYQVANRAELFQGACTFTPPCEGEMARYNVMFDMPSISGDVRITYPLCIVIGLLFTLYTSLGYVIWNTIGVQFKRLALFVGILLIVLLFVCSTLLYGFFSTQRYATFEDYKDHYNILLKFVKELQSKYKTSFDNLKDSYKDLVKSIIKRIIKHQGLITEADGADRFKNMSPERLLEYICFDKDYEGGILTNAQSCLRNAKDQSLCTKIMFINFVNKEYKDQLSKTISYDVMKTEIDNVIQQPNSSINGFTTGEAFITGNDIATLIQYIPFKYDFVDKDNIIKAFDKQKMQFQLGDNVCNSLCNFSTFKPNDTYNLLKGSTDNLTVTQYTSIKTDKSEFAALVEAIKVLQSRDYLNPIPEIRERTTALFWMLMLVCAIYGFIIFHNIYHSFEVFVIALVVIAIVASVASISSLFKFV